MMSEQHVVICGGGMMGCALSFYLSRLAPSLRLTVVECGASVASQASGRAGGFLAADWCAGALDNLAKKSFELHNELSKELQTDIGYRQLDTLSVQVARESANTGTNKSLPNFLDASKVRSASSLGTTATTAQVHPELLVKALFAAASKQCQTTLIRGKVKGMQCQGHKVKSVLVQRYEDDQEIQLDADVVVVAMGPWSDAARKWFPRANLPYITGGRAHSIVMECDSADAKAVFLGTPDGDPEIYPRPDNTVYVCGSSDDHPLPSNPAEVEANIESCSELHKIVSNISPDLAKAKVMKQQACFLPYCPDGKPIIGALKNYQGAYIATGHGCWGILNGPATGLGLAELIVKGKAESVDLKPFDPARFS